MTSDEKQTKYTIAQFGALKNSAQARLAIGQANQVQSIFRFDWYRDRLDLDLAPYRLPNGGYALDDAAESLLKHKKALPRPLILLTSHPYGDPDHGEDENYFFFSDHDLSFDKQVSLVSTHAWMQLLGKRELQTYLLLMLATEVFSKRAGLEFHFDSKSCLFDYCEDQKDIDRCLETGELCNTCDENLQAGLKSGVVDLQTISAGKRLLARASGRKMCFVAIPFAKEFLGTYHIVKSVLEAEGWRVVRGDELLRPRNIMIAINERILSSNLIVADLTGQNPNVFYEVGMAHAYGRDLLALTQEAEIPFDLAPERTIRYNSDVDGTKALTDDLKRFAGSGRF
jgi:hypothetical protein